MSVITLKDGRVLNGVVINATGRILTVQTQNEQVKLDRNDVEEMQGTPVSLMPEGMLTTLSESEVRDLISYLMSRQQVALPMEVKKK
jgi:putative heme-binding domain-containing protein